MEGKKKAKKRAKKMGKESEKDGDPGGCKAKKGKQKQNQKETPSEAFSAQMAFNCNSFGLNSIRKKKMKDEKGAGDGEEMIIPWHAMKDGQKANDEEERNEESDSHSSDFESVLFSSSSSSGEETEDEEEEGSPEAQEDEETQKERVKETLNYKRSLGHETCEYFPKTVTFKGEEIPLLVKRLQFCCPYCDKQFDRKSLSMVHFPCYYMRTGTTGNGDKTDVLKCEFCPKRFAGLYLLRSHVATHADVNLFKCVECGKYSYRQDKATLHYKTHSGH